MKKFIISLIILFMLFASFTGVFLEYRLQLEHLPALGDVYGTLDSIVDSYNLGLNNFQQPGLIRINSTNYYADITGTFLGKGYVTTYMVYNTNGTIGKSQVDSLYFNDVSTDEKSIIHFTSDIYLLVYANNSNWIFETIRILEDGSILDTAVSYKEFPNEVNIANTTGSEPILFTDNIITWVHSTGAYNFRAINLSTVWIDTNGIINGTLLDTIQISNFTDGGGYPRLSLIDSNTMAIVEGQQASNGIISTRNITSYGDISSTPSDVWNLTFEMNQPDIIKANGNYFVVAWGTTVSGVGNCAVTTIDNSGSITKSWANNTQSSTYGYSTYHSFTTLGGKSNNNYFLLSSLDDNGGGLYNYTVRTIIVSDIGNITSKDCISVVNIVGTSNWYSPLVSCGNDYFLLEYYNSSDNGLGSTYGGYLTSLHIQNFTDAPDIYVWAGAPVGWYNETQVDNLTHAIDNVTEGGTIHLWEGSYYPPAPFTKNLNISGNSSDTVIINGQGILGDAILSTSVSINISNVTIRNGNEGVSFYFGSSGSSLTDCVIENIGIESITLTEVSFINVSNCTISSNQTGISGTDFDNCTFTWNIINALNRGFNYDSAANPPEDNLAFNNMINSTDGMEDAGLRSVWNISKTLGTNIIGGEYLGGNYWSDYTGADSDGDGIGDTAYDNDDLPLYQDICALYCYFDSYNSTTDYSVSNIMDGSLNTSASMAYESTTFNHTSNICTTGTIFSVRVRIYGYWWDQGAGVGSATFRPIYTTGFGNVIDSGLPADTPTWSSWFNITADTNAPSWTWNNITNFCINLTVESDDIFYIYQMELEVLYLSPYRTPVYVDDDFDSSYAGWGNNTFNNLTYAIENVTTGGTIFVKPGQYIDNIEIDKILTLKSYDTIYYPVISGGGNTAITVTASYVNISKLNIISCGGNRGIYLSSVNYTNIDNCTIGSNTYYGVYLSNSNNNSIRDCEIESTAETSIRLTYSSYNNMSNNDLCAYVSLNADYSDYNTFFNNNFTMCAFQDVSLSYCNYSIFYGNEFEYFTYFQLSGKYNTLYNNILLYTGGTAGGTLYLPAESEYNLIYNNYLTGIIFDFESYNNTFNSTKIRGTNIIGGPYIGGNYWSDYSYTSEALDGFGLTPNYLKDYWSSVEFTVDYLPLVNSPVFYDVTIVTTEANVTYKADKCFNITLWSPSDPVFVYLQLKNDLVITNYTMVWQSGSNLTGAFYVCNLSFSNIGTYEYRFISKYNPTGYTGWLILSVSSPYFGVNFPTYIKVGDYIFGTGTIANETVVPLDMIWVNTTILYSATNTTVPLSNLSKYVTNGDYLYIFSTSTMVPGLYYIDVNFTQDNKNYSGRWALYLSVTGGPGYMMTDAHFAFYDNKTGQGLSNEIFTLWVNSSLPLSSSDRIYGTTYFNTYTGQTLYYRVYDYFNMKVYPATGDASINISELNQIVDIPVNWYTLSIKNMNQSIVKIVLTNDSRNVSQYLFSYEPVDFKVLPGEYNLTISFYNPNSGAFVETKYHNITVSNDDVYYFIRGYMLDDIVINVGTLQNRSVLSLSFYNTNEGLGLPEETLKIYVNGSRVIDRVLYVQNGTTVNVTIKDYYNQTLYWGNHTISSDFMFLDFGLTFHSYKFCNMNEQYYMISFLKDNATRWYERAVCPYETIEYLLPSGLNYTLRIYNASLVELCNFTVDILNSKLYIMNGTNLSLIIAGQSVIVGQLLELQVELGVATMADIVSVGYNVPYIYSLFDREGQLIGGNTIKICPAQIMMATTYNETWSNNTVSALIPDNTTANGTIMIQSLDRIWFHGMPNNTYVNLSYTNGTLVQNTTYIPTFYDPGGAPIVITTSHNMSITRESRFQQVKKFYWTKYTDTSKYTATLNFTNPLSTTLKEVYLFIEFANDTTPDYTTVQVYDVTNGVYLRQGEHFDASSTGVHLALTSITSLSQRLFTIIYYAGEDVKQPSDAIIVLDDWGTMRTYNDKSYYYLKAQWINTRDDTFIGPIYIQFNFTSDYEISRESVVVYDVEKVRYLSRNEFAYQTSGIVISQEAVGEISPQSARTFEIYYLHISEETPTEQLTMEVQGFMKSPIFHIPYVGDFLGIHLIVTALVGIGLLAVASGKRPRDNLWFLALCLFFVFLAVMSYLQLGG